MAKKNELTKRDKYAILATIVEQSVEDEKEKALLTDFIAHEVELLDKKQSSSKSSPASAFTMGVKAAVYNALSELPPNSAGVRSSDLLNMPYLATVAEENGQPLCIQRVTSVLRELRKEGKVKRTMVKKVAYFSLGKDEEFYPAE